MFRVPSISGLFKWRQFEPEVILMAVGWYLRVALYLNRRLWSITAFKCNSLLYLNRGLPGSAVYD